MERMRNNARLYVRRPRSILEKRENCPLCHVWTTVCTRSLLGDEWATHAGLIFWCKLAVLGERMGSGIEVSQTGSNHEL